MKTFKINKEKSDDRIKQITKWSLLILAAFAVGILCGAIGGSFARSISFVTDLRSQNPWLVFLLPFGGLASVGLYKLTKTEGLGTDRALESVQGRKNVPILLVPVIFVASVITHLFGGSAGKEGAALQLGSGIAEFVSKIIKAGERTHAVMTICGMAALFSAVFGTPVGACVFALEVAVIGRMNAVAVFPAFISSITAYFISTAIGMTVFFGGVTNCPIASAVLAVELFGTNGFILFAAAAFSSRVFSGKVSLYHKQKAKELKC